MGIFIKASAFSIATYFAIAAYDFYGRDDLKSNPLINGFPPTSVIGKTKIGIGYDGKVLTGFYGDDNAVQWEINKGNNDEAYKKKLIAVGFRILSGSTKEFYRKALPQGYQINISDYEMSKAIPAQEMAGFALMNQIISLQKDDEMRNILGMPPSRNFQ